MTCNSRSWPRERGTSLQQRDCSVFVHVRRTQAHSPQAAERLTVCGSIMATSKIKIFLQLSGGFFERGGHEPADSQTSFQHSHTVFATGRPKKLHSQETNLYGRKHSRAHQQAVLKCLASSQRVDVRAVGNRVFFCTFLVCEDNMVPALHCARLNSTQLKHMLQPNARCLVYEGKRKEWRGKKMHKL